MARGIPGKPPPVPTSKIFDFGANEMTFEMERLGRRCLSKIDSVSLRDIRLIFSFQSKIEETKAFSLECWSSFKSGKKCRMMSLSIKIVLKCLLSL